MCAWAPNLPGCETAWSDFKLPEISLGNMDFTQMGHLLKIPHLENLFRLPDWQAIEILMSAPLIQIDGVDIYWPDLSLALFDGAPVFNNFSFGSNGLPFRLPDFRPNFNAPEFFAAFPELADFYNFIS